MQPGKSFMVKGKKSQIVPVTRRTSVMMMAPLAEPQGRGRTKTAAYGAIMSELSSTKSRIYKVIVIC